MVDPGHSMAPGWSALGKAWIQGWSDLGTDSWGLGSAPGWPRVETTLDSEKALALEQMRKDGQSEAVTYPILCRATPLIVRTRASHISYIQYIFYGLGTLAFALVPITGAASPWPPLNVIVSSAKCVRMRLG